MAVDTSKLSIGDVLEMLNGTTTCEVIYLDGTSLFGANPYFASRVVCKHLSGVNFTSGPSSVKGALGLFWLNPGSWNLMSSAQKTPIKKIHIPPVLIDDMLGMPKLNTTKASGGNCKGCNTFNEYQDGPYLCFICRS